MVQEMMKLKREIEDLNKWHVCDSDSDSIVRITLLGFYAEWMHTNC